MKPGRKDRQINVEKQGSSIISLVPCQGQWKGDTGEVILLSKLFRDVIKLLRAVSGASGHRHLVLICTAVCPNSLASLKVLVWSLVVKALGELGAERQRVTKSRMNSLINFLNSKPSARSGLQGW